MPANDIFELNVDQTLSGQNITNTYHAKQTSADGTGDARTALHLWWVEHFQTEFLNCVSANLATIQTRVRRIKPTETQSLTTAMAANGGQSDEHLPPQSCMIMRQHATPSGRRGTGHVKISGVGVSAVQFGKIDNAQRLLNILFGNEMEAGHTETTTGYVFHLGVYSQVDTICRLIEKAESLTRIKTVHSRSVGVGS